MMQAKSKRRARSAVFGLSFAVVPVFTQQTKQSADYKAPLEVRREFFNGIHVAKDDPKFQMEAQHYCSPLKSGMFQCVLFDSTGADAKLMGIEYIISDAVYTTLPDGEKKFWHPHPFEVLGGGLIAPDMSPDKEKKFIDRKSVV